jgi:hypothetical protein
MSLKGKGFMIWKVRDCEGGNPTLIASEAQKAGLTHVLIKIADGTNPYNIDNNVDKVPPVLQALHSKGIETWGWHYVYGDNPVAEAQMAISRVKNLGLTGYIIDAEAEYKLPGRETNARAFMSELRKSLPNLPVALSSYRFPTLHREFPWAAFLEKCNFNMPQVYWVNVHNPDAQLQRTIREFQAMNPYRPIMPTGPVYRYGDWEPTPADMVEFLNATRVYNLSAANFFTWDYRSYLSSLWDAISSYAWGNTPSPQEIPILYMQALNTHDLAKVGGLYRNDAVHVTAAQTVQGITPISSWHQNLFTNILPNALFTLTGTSGSGNSWHFTWKAASSFGTVLNGNDTLGILNGKIVYHYSYFTVAPV